MVLKMTLNPQPCSWSTHRLSWRVARQSAKMKHPYLMARDENTLRRQIQSSISSDYIIMWRWLSLTGADFFGGRGWRWNICIHHAGNDVTNPLFTYLDKKKNCFGGAKEKIIPNIQIIYSDSFYFNQQQCRAPRRLASLQRDVFENSLLEKKHSIPLLNEVKDKKSLAT